MEWRQEHTTTATIRTGREYGAWPVLFESDGRVVVLSFSNGLNTVSRWDPQSGREVWRVDPWAGGGPCAVVQAKGVGSILAVASESGVERLNAVTGSVLSSPAMEAGTVWDVAAGVLPDGRAVIVGAGHHHEVHRWDAATGEPLGVPLTGHGTPVMSVAIVSGSRGSGSVIATGDEAGVILRWDAATGARIGERMTGPEGAVHQIVPVRLPGGPTLLACVDGDRFLWRWDAATGELVGKPVPLGMESEHPRLAIAVVDGAVRTLVSGTDDGLVWEWDLLTGRRLHAAMPGICCDVLVRSNGRAVIATGSPEGDLTLYA